MKRNILLVSKKKKRPEKLKHILDKNGFLVTLIKDFNKVKKELKKNVFEIVIYFFYEKTLPDVFFKGFERDKLGGQIATIIITEKELKKRVLSDKIFYLDKAINNYMVLQLAEDILHPKIIEKIYPVLLISDDENEKNIISITLERLGCEIFYAKNKKEADLLLTKRDYSLIILNPSKIHIDKVVEICYEIKNKKALMNTPLVVFSLYAKQQDIYSILTSGADDVIRKPYYPEELCSRILAHLKLNNIIQELEDVISTEEHLNMQLLELNEELKETNDLNKRLAKALEEQAMTDELTGVYNRRQVIQILRRGVNHAYDYKKDLSCIIVDIDLFKKINDTYGHDFGDKVIRETAMIVNLLLESDCSIGRWGGEEFVVVLLGYNKKATLEIAENIRKKVKSHVYKSKSKGISAQITISQGVSMLKKAKKEHEIDTLVNRADNGLYVAKENGRDCVIFVD